MERDNPKIFIHLAKKLFNITPVENKIVVSDSYTHRNFFFIDAKSKKKYILLLISHVESTNKKLIDIIDQVEENAYKFTIKTEQFSTTKIFKTPNGKLSAFESLSFIDVYGKKQIKPMNVKVLEFLPGQTITNYINNSLDFSECEGTDNLYRNLGYLCGHLTDFFDTQTKYVEELASLRSDFAWQTSTCDTVVYKLANWIYPDKSQPRRMMIDDVLEEFDSIKQRFNALPKHVLHGALSPKNILFNADKTNLMSNSGCHFQKLHLSVLDYQELQVGPQCVELATLILNCILEKNRVYDSPFFALIRIPKLIIKGYRFRWFTNEFFRTRQLEFLPIVMKLRLCQFLLSTQVKLNSSPLFENLREITNYGWTLLNIWLWIFHDNDELIDIWSKVDPEHANGFLAIVNENSQTKLFNVNTNHY